MNSLSSEGSGWRVNSRESVFLRILTPTQGRKLWCLAPRGGEPRSGSQFRFLIAVQPRASYPTSLSPRFPMHTVGNRSTSLLKHQKHLAHPASTVMEPGVPAPLLCLPKILWGGRGQSSPQGSAAQAGNLGPVCVKGKHSPEKCGPG